MAKVTKASLDELHQDLANLNKHAERGSALTRKSIERFGARLAGVVDKHNRIIDGNDRQIAFGEVDLNEIEIVEADPNKPVYLKFNDLDLADPDNPARELQVALHRSAVESFAIDAENLLAHLNEGLDVKQWFNQDELDALLDGLVEKEPMQPAEAQTDKAAELQKLWNTQPGQLWALGRHRLIVGDCTDKATVERLMQGEKAVLMLTDPPYGVDYGELVRSRSNQKKEGWNDIQNDALSDDDLYELLKSSLHGCGATVGFVWHPAGARRWLFWKAVEENGWRVAQEIVWVKNALVFGRADYQWRHEPCLYLKREGAPRQEDRTQTTVWEINKPTDSVHPTMKPVDLFAISVKNHTATNDIVYEPFAGSGTTIIACEQLNRQCRAVEISPAYCAVILQRYKDSTNVEPVLIDTVTKQ